MTGHVEKVMENFARAERAEAEVDRLRGEIRRAQASLALEMYAGSRSKTAAILRDALSSSASIQDTSPRA